MGFIGDTFSCKGMGLAEVGVKGKSIRSFVLRTYIVGGLGVKKLYID